MQGERVLQCVTSSPQETKRIAKEFARQLQPGTVLCFRGDLGAGKTTFIKGLVEEVSKVPEIEVSSPTFTYLNVYEGPTSVYHFDLYRLQDEEDFYLMGFDEYFSSEGICCVEWSERIPHLTNEFLFVVEMKHLDGQGREICITRM